MKSGGVYAGTQHEVKTPGPDAHAVPEDKAVSNAQSDVDFSFGRWKVHSRRLRVRLRGSTVWEEFDGTAFVRPILGGKGNVNEYEAQGPSDRILGFADARPAHRDRSDRRTGDTRTRIQRARSS